MTAPQETSLDKIITLIKIKRIQEKEIRNDLRQVQNELDGLCAQARAALQGSGMDLILTGELATTVVTSPKLNITDFEELLPGDKVKVKVKFGNCLWEEAVVTYTEEYGFGVEDDLSDDSDFVDTEDDEWEFISRP